MMNQRCYARLGHTWKSPIEAVLIAFVPSPEVRTVRMNGSREDLCYCNTPISVDCIVRLLTFNKDEMYQVPLECVKLVDKFEIESYNELTEGM